MREDRDEGMFSPNDGYGRFAVGMSAVCAVLIGVAEWCGVSIERGTDRLLAVRVVEMVTATFGLAALLILLLATCVHVRVCATLRRVNRERKRSKDSSIPIINYQKQQRNED